MEAKLNSLKLGPESFVANQIWGIEDKHNENAKNLFNMPDSQWGRDSTWGSTTAGSNSTGTNAENGLSEHIGSQPINVKRTTYGPDGAMNSPRSNDTGGLGLKMAEYVLDNSPSSRDENTLMQARLMQTRLVDQANEKLQRKVDKNQSVIQGNGLSNGFEDVGDSNKLFDRASVILPPMDDPDEIQKLHNKSVMESMLMPGSHQPSFPDFASNIDSFAATNNDYGNFMPQLADPIGMMGNYMYGQRGNGTSNANNGTTSMSMLTSQPNMMTQHNQLTQSSPGQMTAAGSGNASNAMFPSGAPGQNTQAAYIDSLMNQNMLLAAASNPLMSQYYNAYNFPPWGLYPGLLANGQIGPNPSLNGNGANGSAGNRPLSPNSSGVANPMANSNDALLQSQRFALIPMAGAAGIYPDQNSLAAFSAGGRALGPGAQQSTAMPRMMPQMNMIPNNSTGSGNMRMMNQTGNQNGNGLNQNQANGNPMYANPALGYNANLFSNGHPNNQMTPQMGKALVDFFERISSISLYFQLWVSLLRQWEKRTHLAVIRSTEGLLTQWD